MKVFTNGCFDIVHVGHLKLLEECRRVAGPANEYGRIIVGLNSDASIKRLKGTGRPVNNEKDRKYFLESIKFVSEVIIFDEDTPYELIKEVEPHMIIKGGDYDGSVTDPDDARYIVGSDLCETKVFDLVGDYSTTRILKGRWGFEFPNNEYMGV